ncbi:MAG: DUF481 domain-containing protein [Vicinamibacterales bacterium]
MKRSVVGRVLLAAVLAAWPAAAQEAADTVTLHLSDGSVVVGRILQEADGRVRVATETFGEVTIDAARIIDRGAVAAPQPAQVAAPPPPPTAAPAAAGVQWQRTAAVNASYVSAPFIQSGLDPSIPELTGAAIGLPGRQVSVQANLSVRRAAARSAMQLTGSVGYTDAQPTGKLAEAYSAEFDYYGVITPRVYWLTRTTERRDEVRRINNAFLETLGIGFIVKQTPRARLDLTPGLVVHHEEKQTRFDNEWLLSLGGMAAGSFMFTPRSGIEGRIIGRRSVQHGEIWSFESYAGVQAALSARVTLTTGLTYNYDNLLGESVTEIPAGRLFAGSPELRLFATRKKQVQLSSGLQIRF